VVIVRGIRDRAGTMFAMPASGFPIGNSRILPLAVLVNDGTRSAAEMIAGAFQRAGGARLIEGRTAGDAGNLVEKELEGGGVIGVTGGTFILPDGSDPGWLGRGIVPDIVVPGSSWDEVTEKKDPALAKAIETHTLRQ